MTGLLAIPEGVMQISCQRPWRPTRSQQGIDQGQPGLKVLGSRSIQLKEADTGCKFLPPGKWLPLLRWAVATLLLSAPSDGKP